MYTRMPTDAWGIQDGFFDAAGVWYDSRPGRPIIRAAMGVDPSDEAGPGYAPVWVVRQGDSPALLGPVEITLEDGTQGQADRAIPARLPLGYHTLQPREGGPPVTLIVAPRACHLPPGLRTWGWAVQLYATRSAASWGMGDLADLRRLGEWSTRVLGAGMVLVNPLGAALPIPAQQASPYFPSSRRYRNPLYLRVEEVPGAAEAGLELTPLAAAGRSLNESRVIDRPAVFALKLAALERIWERGRGRSEPGFDAYWQAQGESLTEFAVFCTLAEHYGAGWYGWPEEHRRPDATGVAPFAQARAERVRFHAWLQWLLEAQLDRAAEAIPVVQDLPVGVDPDGADAWAWQDVLARGVSVGAPPDAFNTQGQDWGLPPFVPHRLRAARYRPFVETVRSALRRGGGLRIDHVMGLFRLYWVPHGAGPRAGAYVRYPAEDLLGILALESVRAGAYIVGEDLGTVEEGVRERLAAQNVLSYRLLWFEPKPPEQYPELALSAVTTHDLPTVAGLWTGSDLAEQAQLGLQPNVEGTAEMRARFQRAAGLRDAAPVEEAVVRAHELLARAPSRVLTATLDDALAVEERPNIPGTTTERPNWSIALPLPLEAIESQPLVHAVAAACRERGTRSVSG